MDGPARPLHADKPFAPNAPRRPRLGTMAAASHQQLPEADALLFHEPWWLDAVTGGDYHQAQVSRGGQIVGRLPYILARNAGFTISPLPPFTHALGPVVLPSVGKPQTLMLRRMSIVRELIDQLPKVAFLKQALTLSLSDGLLFQHHGFQVTPQYTFEIDARESLTDLWSEVHSKTRQHIRRAEEKFSVVALQEPNAFTDFYVDNLRRAGLRSFVDFTRFPAMFFAAQERRSAEILCASWPNGKPAAMVVLVWGHGRMYYLMSTRARDAGDNGSINLLIWEAVKRAHERGLLFDLDGITTSGTSRFLRGFGGRCGMRLIVQRTSPLYSVLRTTKRLLGRGKADDTTAFT